MWQCLALALRDTQNPFFAEPTVNAHCRQRNIPLSTMEFIRKCREKHKCVPLRERTIKCRKTQYPIKPAHLFRPSHHGKNPSQHGTGKGSARHGRSERDGVRWEFNRYLQMKAAHLSRQSHHGINKERAQQGTGSARKLTCN